MTYSSPEMPPRCPRAGVALPPAGVSPWIKTHGFDQRARALADRHYTRQKKGNRQFVPPGKRLVLVTRSSPRTYGALWVTLSQKYVRHPWPGAWFCSLFRNEAREHLSSDLIRWAVSETIERWGSPPSYFLTLVDAKATVAGRSKSSEPGACFLHAGWEPFAVLFGPEGSKRGGAKHVLRWIG